MAKKTPFRIALDKKEIRVDNDENCPALHPKWKTERQFVVFHQLPRDEHDVASIEEWLERADFIEQDLQWLLRLEHDKFWCQVVFDETLGRCIDSFLKYAPRSHDSIHVKSYPQDVQDKLNSLYRLVFVTSVRMATHKESKEDFITHDVFGEILYENFIFDIPKILDLCSLYGQTNGALLSKMVSNIFTRQPKYLDDLRHTLQTISQVFDNITQKCGVHELPSTPQKLVVGRASSSLKTLSTDDLNDIISYILDIAVTLSSFTEIYEPACKVLLEGHLLTRLISFYDITITEICEEIKQRTSEPNRLNMKRPMHRAKKCIVKTVRQLIQHCYIQDIVKHSTGEEIEELVEGYLNVMSELLEYKRFLADYEEIYPFQDDLDIVHQTSYLVDDTRLKFLQDGIQETINARPKKVSKTIKKNKSTSPSDKVGQGHLEDVAEQWACTVESSTSSSYNVRHEVEGATASCPAITGVQLDSLISSIQDLLPDLGQGFIQLCLEELNYNAESVISAVLEDKLPPSLDEIDRSMEALDGPEEPETILATRHNVYDNDEFDVFGTASVDFGKIHRGKKNKLSKDVLDDADDRQSMKEKIAEYERAEEVRMYEVSLYDDEYDDTYDDTMVGADDADSADELTVIRPFTVPRILAPSEPKRDSWKTSHVNQDTEEDERKRDEFVMNPAVLREQHAQRIASQRGRPRQPVKKYDVEGKAKGQGQESSVLKNRSFKEKNKSSRSNHNRRNMADKKMSKGMF